MNADAKRILDTLASDWQSRHTIMVRSKIDFERGHGITGSIAELHDLGLIDSGYRLLETGEVVPAHPVNRDGRPIEMCERVYRLRTR